MGALSPNLASARQDAPPHPKTKISALARDPARSWVPREGRNFAFGGRLRAHILKVFGDVLFVKIGTETWVSNSGITATFTLDAGYETSLSDTVAAGDPNGLSEEEEQFLADIIEGVIVDELAAIKYNNEPYERIADNSEIKTSEHPVYILSGFPHRLGHLPESLVGKPPRGD